MKMNNNVFLESEHIYFSPISEKDYETISQFMNEETYRILGRKNGSIVYESKFKERMVEILKDDEIFVIYRKDTNAIIGDICLSDIDKINRSAMLGIGIGKDENRDKGFGKEAMILMLKHAFIDLNLESVNLGTYEYNKRAIHLYEKIGFKKVGRHRNAKIVGNKFFDDIIMDILSSEYFELYGNYEMEKYNLEK
jgi:RimJ/RimL family protein N-acetyltransferase